MGSGTGIPIVLPVSPFSGITVAPKWLTKMTLDVFSRITHYDPLVFQGGKIFGKCDPLTSKGRDDIIEAFTTAFEMMDQLVIRRGKNTFDTNVDVVSLVPYFDLSGHQTKIMTEKTYRASISYFPTANMSYTDIAELTLTIDPLDSALHETVTGAQVSFGSLGKRFGVEWIDTPSIDAMTLVMTIHAKAYNFIDIDSIVDPAAPPYLDEVDVIVTTVKDSTPLVYWPTQACNELDSCGYTTTDGCLMLIRDDQYKMKYNRTDLCYGGRPVKFVMPCIQDGAWRNTWQDGMVSLANCLTVESYGECQPLVNERWEEDQGRGPKWEKTYRYSFWNPFGIASPGAQKCWKQMEMSLGSSRAWNA